jgi:aspartyl/asparaginyl beta-hydroxylase (cupin superfamily)
MANDPDATDYERLEKDSFQGMTPTPIEDRPLAPDERFALVRSLIADKKLPVSTQPLRRPAFFYPGLPSEPTYDADAFAWAASIRSHVPDFEAELAAVEDQRRGGQSFQTVWPKFTAAGEWTALWLRLYGQPYEQNAAWAPKTLAAVDGVPGQVGWLGFSAMAPRTHIAPHSGVSNVKLRCHVPLELVPESCRIRVGDRIHTWTKGEVFVFDDSFEHEAWNDSETRRVILIFDIFHPDLTAEEVTFLRAMEQQTARPSYNALMQHPVAP